MVTIPDGKLMMLKILNFSSVQDAVLQIRDGQNSSMKHLETFREDDIIEQKTLVFSYIQLWIQVNSSLEKDILFLAVFEAVDKCKKTTLIYPLVDYPNSKHSSLQTRGLFGNLTQVVKKGDSG